MLFKVMLIIWGFLLDLIDIFFTKDAHEYSFLKTLLASIENKPVCYPTKCVFPS